MRTWTNYWAKVSIICTVNPIKGISEPPNGRNKLHYQYNLLEMMINLATKDFPESLHINYFETIPKASSLAVEFPVSQWTEEARGVMCRFLVA